MIEQRDVTARGSEKNNRFSCLRSRTNATTQFTLRAARSFSFMGFSLHIVALRSLRSIYLGGLSAGSSRTTTTIFTNRSRKRTRFSEALQRYFSDAERPQEVVLITHSMEDLLPVLRFLHSIPFVRTLFMLGTPNFGGLRTSQLGYSPNRETRDWFGIRPATSETGRPRPNSSL